MFERKLLAASWETRAGIGAGHSQCGWQGIPNTCLRVVLGWWDGVPREVDEHAASGVRIPLSTS